MIPRPRTVLLLAAVVVPGLARAAPAVYVTQATEKIRPTESLTTVVGGKVYITAARNEFEAFQVAVAGPESSVTVTAPTLTGPGGAQIPAQDVRLYREGYITTTYASTSDVTTGRWPDPLIPDVDVTANEKRNAFPFDVPAGENRVVWVDVLVPISATPGYYTGTLTVHAASGATPVSVRLRVYPFSIPSTSPLASIFGVGWDALCIGYYGSYSSPSCGDAGVVRLDKQMGVFLLDHRISGSVIYTGPTAHSTGYDWTTWDATYGPMFDGTAPTRLPGAKLTLIQYEWKRTAADYAAWAAHFRAKGWFDRTFDYTLDEPHTQSDWNTFISRAAMVHQADPGMRTLVTGTIQDATKYGALSSVDILVPVINYMDDKPGHTYSGSQRSAYDGFIQGGGMLMWYQSCMSEGCSSGTGSKSYSNYNLGWPSMMIDTPAVYNRVEEWLSYLYGISGELYWSTTYAMQGSGDPWQTQWYFGGNGDGTLVYPGTPAEIGGTTPVPVPSIRLDLVREGMEDYAYLAKLDALGDGAFARQEAETVATSPHGVNPDPSVLYAARAALAARIIADTTASADGGTPGDGGGADGGLGTDGGAGAQDGGANDGGTAGDGGARTGGTGRGCGCSAAATGGGVEAILVLLAVAGLRRRARS